MFKDLKIGERKRTVGTLKLKQEVKQADALQPDGPG